MRLTDEERQYLAQDTARLIDGGMGEALLYTAPVVAKLLDALSVSETARAGLRGALEFYADYSNWVAATGPLGDALDGCCGVIGNERAWDKARAALARDGELG